MLGLSSVESLAAQTVTDGTNGKFSVIIDVQRGEFYLASYEVEHGNTKETAPLRLASRTEVEERERDGDLLVGSEVTRWFSSGKIGFPQAATLARLATTRSDFVSREKLDPIYLRETTFVKAPPAKPLPFAP